MASTATPGRARRNGTAHRAAPGRRSPTARASRSVRIRRHPGAGRAARASAGRSPPAVAPMSRGGRNGHALRPFRHGNACILRLTCAAPPHWQPSVSSTECSVCDTDVAMPASSEPAHWPAIASLTLGVFGLVTAEFLPASLLTAMAADLRISEGAAGQTVTATALVGAMAAPSIPVLTRRMDRRHVMLALTLLLPLSNALAIVADDLWTLLASRVLLGISL